MMAGATTRNVVVSSFRDTKRVSTKTHGSVSYGSDSSKYTIGEKTSKLQLDIFLIRIVHEELGKMWQDSSLSLTRATINGETGPRVLLTKDLERMETEMQNLGAVTGTGHVGMERKVQQLASQAEPIMAQTTTMVDKMHELSKMARRLLKSDGVVLDETSSMEPVQALQAVRAAVAGTLKFQRDRRSLARALGQFFLDKWQTDSVWLVVVGDRNETGWYVFYNEYSHVSMKVGEFVVFIAEVTDDEPAKKSRAKNSLLETNVADRIRDMCHDIVQYGDRSQTAKQICDTLDCRFGESFQCVYGKKDKFYTYLAHSASVKPRLDLRVKVQVGVDKEVEAWRQ